MISPTPLFMLRKNQEHTWLHIGAPLSLLLGYSYGFRLEILFTPAKGVSLHLVREQFGRVLSAINSDRQITLPE